MLVTVCMQLHPLMRSLTSLLNKNNFKVISKTHDILKVIQIP